VADAGLSETLMRVPHLPARHHRWFTDRPVAVKVLTAVGTTAAVAVTVGVVGIQAVGSLHDETAAVSKHDMAGAADLATAQLAMTESQLDVTSHVGSLDPQFKARWADRFATAATSFDDALAAYAQHTRTGDQSLIEAARAEYASYADGVQSHALPASAAGDTRGYFAARDQYLTPHMTRVQEILTELTSAEKAAAEAAVVKARDNYEATRTTLLVLLATGVLLAVGLGVLVARSMTRGVREVQRVAEALAAGDLTATSGLDSRDEVGRMAAALDTAQENLRAVITSVVSSADAVAASSEELSASSSQISVSAEETSA